MNFKNNVVKILLTIILIFISLLNTEYRAYWIADLFSITLNDLLYFAVSFIVLTIFGLFLIKYYIKERIINFKDHIVVNSFEMDDILIIWVIFPTTMIFEEILFRIILIGSLFNFLQFNKWFSISSSSIIFSLYHLHTWPTFRDKKITVVFMVYSLFLGIICGYFLFITGVLGPLIIHWFSVYILYKNIYKRIKKTKQRDKLN